MDRALYVGMNAAIMNQYGQAVTANNIANANTTGFKKEIPIFDKFDIDSSQARNYSTMDKTRVSFEAGGVVATNNPLDFAINGDGFVAVLGKDGKEGYIRSSQLSVSSDRTIVDSNGNIVLDINNNPIQLEAFTDFNIGNDGGVFVKFPGETNYTRVAEIKTVAPDTKYVFKRQDGLFSSYNSTPFEINQNVKLNVGSVEGSNVSSSEELANMINYQRNYERNIKLMNAIKEMSQSEMSLFDLN